MQMTQSRFKRPLINGEDKLSETVQNLINL